MSYCWYCLYPIVRRLLATTYREGSTNDDWLDYEVIRMCEYASGLYGESSFLQQGILIVCKSFVRILKAKFVILLQVTLIG